MQLRFAIALVFAAACVEPPDDPPIDPRDGDVLYTLPGREHQGRRLLGKGVDPLAGRTAKEHWSADPTTIVASGFTVAAVTADDGYLSITDTSGGVHERVDPTLVGVSMTMSDGSTVRIDGVAVTDGVTSYQLSRRVGARWSPLCDPRAPAVVVPGYFTRKGEWRSSDRFSFACADGVAHKCVDWGQGPGTGNYEPCTRMARADYCHNGNSHTLDGTEIVFYDFNPLTAVSVPPYANITSPPPPPVTPGSMWFEAGWKVETGEVICLSKLRWQALPPGGHCWGDLPDPRTDDRGVFCENLPKPQIAALVHAGAILINESSYNDIGLYQWSLGSNYYTTTRGLYGGVAEPTVPPLPGYGAPVWQGTIFTTAGAGRIALRSFQHPGTGRVVTTSLPPPAGYSNDLGINGYVATAPIAGITTPLWLYYHVASQRYLTTADPPPAGYGPPPGAAAPIRLGYALRP